TLRLIPFSIVFLIIAIPLFTLFTLLRRPGTGPDQTRPRFRVPSLSPSKCCSITSSDHPPPRASCFHDGHASTAAAAYHETASSDCDDGDHPRKVRSAALELPLPEIRYRCRSLIARIGRCRWRPGHAAAVAAASSEFGYDPMSYALSFKDDRSRELDEEFPARNFSARLPLSPDRLLPVKS
ncbi:hypothetical protein EUGRSUZ_C01698, partial [Eucalyptus grandis]